MLLGIGWDHEKDVSALLLLIHPAQVTTSPLFGEAACNFWKRNGHFRGTLYITKPQGSQVLAFMLFSSWWDHGKDVSALLLLIHPAQATTSPLIGEADVQFLEEKWSLLQYAFQYKPQGSQSIRFWCCLVLVGIMEMMYQPCCCSSILGKQPLHPFFGEADVQFLEEKWPYPQYAFHFWPQGSQVLGFDTAWYLVGS